MIFKQRFHWTCCGFMGPWKTRMRRNATGRLPSNNIFGSNVNSNLFQIQMLTIYKQQISVSGLISGIVGVVGMSLIQFLPTLFGGGSPSKVSRFNGIELEQKAIQLRLTHHLLGQDTRPTLNPQDILLNRCYLESSVITHYQGLFCNIGQLDGFSSLLSISRFKKKKKPYQ